MLLVAYFFCWLKENTPLYIMACFAFNGQPPNPPRVWSRVQGPCSTDPTNYSNIIYSPITKSFITIHEDINLFAMLNKGNVLQYKNNSSNITKNQRYSQIAKGQWVNRNTSWASQTITTSMPNTQSLKRVNYKTIYLDNGAPANTPITCPQPIVVTKPKALPTNPNRNKITPLNINSFIANTDITTPCPVYVNPSDIPSGGGGGGGPPSPALPPKIIPDPKDIIKNLPYIKPPVTPPPRVVIPDGGTLICTISEDICTGQIISTRESNDNCNPTYTSDVPGPIMELCYDDSLPTYYPRKRYIMTNSTNKFPEGYKFTLAN